MVSQSAEEVAEPMCVTTRWEITTIWDDRTSLALPVQNAENTAPTTYVVSCFYLFFVFFFVFRPMQGINIFQLHLWYDTKGRTINFEHFKY